MDKSKLIRDPSKVHAALEERDDVLIAKSPVKIYIPTRYAARKLAVVSNMVRTIAIFCIVVDDKYYGVSLTCANITLKPSATTKVEVDGTEYLEMSFDKGAIVCPNLNLVKIDTAVYYIFDEHIAKGRVPWYITPVDLATMFVSAKRFAGVKLGSSNTVVEMIAAAVMRNPDDNTKYYRHLVKKQSDLDQLEPAIVPLRSVLYSGTNTTAKLLGAYFDDNVLSALVNQSEKLEGIEKHLRS